MYIYAKYFAHISLTGAPHLKTFNWKPDKMEVQAPGAHLTKMDEL